MVQVRVLVPLPARSEGLCRQRGPVLKKLWNNIAEFFGEVKAELKKISYPTRKETIGSTTIVIIFCVIMSMYLSVVDSSLLWLIGKIL